MPNPDILGRLRHVTFFSLAECNAAIREVLMQMNECPIRRLGISRHQLFEAIERPLLRRLPATEYVFAARQLARVGLDYHVEIASFCYSVPHAPIRQQVDVCITARTVEVFHRGKRVCRSCSALWRPTPWHRSEHSAHRRYGEWTPERFKRWRQTIGPSTEGLIIAILAHRSHPEQGFRTCLGVMRLLRGVDPARAEWVASRAIEIGAFNYKSIASILANNLDRRPCASAAHSTVMVHANIRGPRYFH